MEKEVRERFERIERDLERAGKQIAFAGEQIALAGERIAHITSAHQELEAAQANSQKRMDRMDAEAEARRIWIDEKIANLTILVDRLIERDLGRNN